MQSIDFNDINVHKQKRNNHKISKSMQEIPRCDLSKDLPTTKQYFRHIKLNQASLYRPICAKAVILFAPEKLPSDNIVQKHSQMKKLCLPTQFKMVAAIRKRKLSKNLDWS